MVLANVIYYMFIGGVYHDSKFLNVDDGGIDGDAITYWQSSYGYLLILLMSLMERVCL